MPPAQATILFAILCFSQIVKAVNRPIAEETKKQLQVISSSSKVFFNRGVLLTPPAGSIDPNINATRHNIVSLINELGGEALKNFNGNIVVNIFSNPNANAWVEETKSTPDIKFLLGFNNSDPVVEIGITTGLLNKLGTIDELAFVIGHELTHVIEEHTRHKSIYSSQQQEVIADAKGLERMLGKYELSAAISAMTKILTSTNEEVNEESGKASKLPQAIMAGALTHHHEGQRLSLLQFEIENFRRINENAQPKALTPMPEYMRIPTSRTSPTGIKQAIFDTEIKHKYMKILELYFLMDRVYSPFTDRTRSAKDAPVSSNAASPDQKQMTDFLFEYIEKIEIANISKTTKVNAFLQMQIIIRDRIGKNVWAGLDSFQLAKITRFLAENTADNDGWKLASFIKTENSMDRWSKHMVTRIFLDHPNGQKVLSKLIKIFPEWRSFFERRKNLSIYKNTQEIIEGKALRSELEFAIRVPKGILSQEYVDGVFSQLRIMKIHDINNFFEIDSLLRYTSDTSFAKEAKAAFSQNSFSQRYEELSLSAIQETLDSTQEKEVKLRNINSYFNSLNVTNLTGQKSKDFEKILLDIAKDFDLRTDFNSYPRSELVWILSSRVLADESISLDDRTKMFEFMTMTQKGEENFTKNFETEFSNNLSKFWAARSRVENQVLITRFPSILAKLEKYFIDKLPADYKKRSGWYLNWVEEAFKNSEKGFEELLNFQRSLSYVRINTLKLMGYGGIQAPFLQSLSFKEFNKILQAVNHSRNLNIILNGNSDNISFNHDIRHRDSSIALVKIFIDSLSEQNDFQEWKKIYSQVRTLTGETISLPTEQEKALEEYARRAFSKLSVGEQLIELQKPELKKLLSTENIVEIFFKYLTSKKIDSSKVLKAEIDNLGKIFELRDKSPDAFVLFRNRISEHFNLQPKSVMEIFPDDSRSLTKKTENAQLHIRGLSALLAVTRGEPAAQQIQLIEFLMGRSDLMPNFILETEKDLVRREGSSGFSITTELRAAQDQLKVRTELERSIFVNSFLIGPSGLIAKPQNLAAMSEHILKSVSSENYEFSKILLNSLFAAEGVNKSLFLSYILAQSSSDNRLTESLVLKSLLDSYGVPGVKLAQYLAFTNEFKKFGSILESYQDAAMPISYYEMLTLIQERLGTFWNPEKYKVKIIIGSGSVNIAIEIIDLTTNETKVLNIARKDIETKTKEDFRRFNLLLTELSQNQESKEKFEFVVGLMDIIKKSVNLEFNKEHAFKMQKSVQGLYNRTVDNWRVRTVNAFDLNSMSIFMEKAPGVGARKVYETHPDAYKSALGALLKIEDEVLRGVNEKGNLRPIPLHANPDLHDGQVLIDIKNKVVTFLDFGQAVEISNFERELAVDLLRIISGAESSKKTVLILTARIKQLNIPIEYLPNESSIREILSRTDHMDRFIRLISILNRKGIEIPLSSIHWILAANRLIKLGEKIGVPVETSYRNLIFERKIGLPLTAHNIVSKITQFFVPKKNSTLQLSMTCSSLFLGKK